MDGAVNVLQDALLEAKKSIFAFSIWSRLNDRHGTSWLNGCWCTEDGNKSIDFDTTILVPWLPRSNHLSNRGENIVV